jgi:hypothetical protein
MAYVSLADLAAWKKEQSGLGQSDALTSASSSVGSLVSSTAAQSIQSITVTSNFGGFTVNQPFVPSDPSLPPSIGKQIVQFAQPAVYIQTDFGTIPITPKGAPTADYSGYVLGGAMVILGLATIGALKVLRVIL